MPNWQTSGEMSEADVDLMAPTCTDAASRPSMA